MDNRRRFYLVEGECEKKLIDALKCQPAQVYPGKIKVLNVIQEELKPSQLMTFAPGSVVILIFDTDVEKTDQLKKNIGLLKKQCKSVEVLTAVEVLNFEDEIERATDVKAAPDLTKSKGVSEFKAAVNRMKPLEFRRALNRHRFDVTKLCTMKPPKAFRFVSQDGEKIKISD